MSDHIDTDAMETESGTDDSPRNRREFLGKAAVAAAVTTVAGMSMSKSASAANGDDMRIGLSNTGSNTTELTGGSTFQVTNGNSAAGAAIYGTTNATQGIGVRGHASGTEGIGVYGRNTGSGGIGVYGEHNNTATSGTGVVGTSNNGPGVSGSGSTFDVLANGSGRVLLASNGVANPPTGGSSAGTIAKDSAGNMWVCVVTGNPGTWRKIAGATTSGSLHLLAAPKRVYDSRPGEPPTVNPKEPLAGATRTIDCKQNSSGVPANATGLVLNITVVALSANGFLSVSPGGAGFTGTSTMNWTSTGTIIANGVTVGAGPSATIDITVGGGGNTHFIVDVFGYYL
jgi:hypothetical protein